MMIWSLLAPALAATYVSALSLAQAGPGPTACTNLTLSLGEKKVVSNALSFDYISSRNSYWNTRQSRFAPSCVVYPASAKDVSVALQAIKAAGSRFAIKSGGHNPNDLFSSVDKGVLIDLGSMTAMSYDAKTTLATYEPGSKFGAIYSYFLKYGRTVVGARLGGVGTGLGLGGGLSYLSSQYGMAADGFRELEVVLPSGQIVTASATQNPDLFFACRGGGGNAYGVVTKYIVQSRPAGTFFAGNIIYAFEQTDAVINAIRDFTRYNADPKAAIIGTYEKLPTPDLFLNLDEIIIMFLVYDGPDAGSAFKNFTNIPHLVNSMKQMTYDQVTELPTPGSTQLSAANNMFRVAVHRIEDDTYRQALAAWRNWSRANKGQYTLTSFDFQPIPKSLTDASKAQGGNAMAMPDGPWFWLNFLLTTPPTLTQSNYDALQLSFKKMAESVPSAPGLPLFINDANADQNPLSTFSTYSKLQQIKKKYDPDGFFSSKTGGWSFA